MDGASESDSERAAPREPARKKPEPTASPKKAKPKKKRRLWVRMVRGFGIFLAVLVALVGAVVLYLHTDGGKERVRALIEKKVAAKVHGTAKVGKIDYALGGKIELGDVHLSDTEGREVIGLGSLTVKPAWGETLGGDGIIVDEIAVHGVDVHIVKDDKGGSNLASLFVKDENAKPREPLDKPVVVRSLIVDGVNVTITDPTGTKIALQGAELAGELSALPANKDVHVAISKIGLGVSVEKANGLAIGVKNLSTGLDVDLVAGKGTARLQTLRADVTLRPPGGVERAFPVELGGIDVDLGDGDLDVSLDKLTAGALALASIEVKGKLGEGGLEGPPGADVVGLTIDAARVNELLGKDVLQTNLDLEAHVSGPKDELLFGLKLGAANGKVDVQGKVDLVDAEHPSYDVTVHATDLDTTEIVSPKLGIAPAKIGSIDLTLKGKGKALPDADATAALVVRDVTARGIPIDSAEIDAKVSGGVVHLDRVAVRALEQKVDASGTFEPAKKQLDVTVHVSGDVGVALAKLKAAGLPITASVPKGLVTLDDGDLAVHVQGPLDGELTVDAGASKLGLLGGRGKLDAHATLRRGDVAKGEKPVSVKSLDVSFALSGLRLANVLAMRGKRMPPGIDAGIDLDLHATGTVEDPIVDLNVHATTLRGDGGKRARLDVGARIAGPTANVALTLKDAAKGANVTLVSFDARAPLTRIEGKPALDPNGPLHVHLAIPERSLLEITDYFPAALLFGRKIPSAMVSLDADVDGSVARPTGHLALDLHGALLPGSEALTPPIEQTARITADLAPEGAGSKLDAKIAVAVDSREPALLNVVLASRFARSPLAGGAATAQWTANLDLPPRDAATLPPVPALAKLRALGGTLSAALDANGTASDVNAKLAVDFNHFFTPKGPLVTPAQQLGALPKGGILDAHVGVVLDADKTTVDTTVTLADGALATLRGTAALAGKGLIPRAKAGGLDAPLDLDLDVPTRKVASLVGFSPTLLGIPGDLGGTIHVGGTMKTPTAKGGIDVSHVAMADGTDGGGTLAIDAGVDTIRVGVGYGTPRIDDAPFTIAVEVPRAKIAGLSDGKTLPVSAKLHADHVAMARLLPKQVADKSPVPPTGSLTTDLHADVELEKRDTGIAVAKGSLGGAFDLSASALPLPGTKRSFQDVAVKLSAEDTSLTIDRIGALESDAQVKKRKLDVHGKLELSHALKPNKVEIALSADKWLLFGTPTLGRADAPRGTLTLEAHARAELDRPIKIASLDVDKLDVSVPDRFEKAHQPEDVAMGDLAFLDEGKVAIGKLVVPDAVREKAEAAKAALQAPTIPTEGATSPADVTRSAPAEETGLDLDIHVAKGAKILMSPIEMHPSGAISIAVRGHERKVRGALVMEGGELSLGGKVHPLTKGSLTFDDTHPTGWMDLWFDRPVPPWSQRDSSRASGGDAIEIHMFGPLSDRRTVLSGSGSPGALPDLLSMHNSGKERLLTEPDLATTDSVTFPEYGGILVLSFLSVNLPHLLFLDRVAAWSDPDDDGRAFGHVEHFEGDRYFADGDGRVHAVKRPFTPTRSEAELEVDYLFVNGPQTLFGVGVSGGSRGGGGPGLVFEWSSAD